MTDIKKLVKRLKCKFKTNDPLILCDSLGIVVRYKDMGNVRGMYIHDRRKSYVHINYNISPYLQRQVCAHELGHALLHRKTNTILWDTHTYLMTDRIEIEANMFAAELLIDDSDLKQYEGYTQDHVANVFGVQERMVEYKIQLLKKTPYIKEGFR